MGVLRPLKLVIDNYPDGQVEELDAINNPEDPGAGTRKVPFSKVLYIEQDDFREVPPPKYFRLTPGQEVRLRYAYFVKCTGCVKDRPPARSPRFTAATTRPPAAAARPTAARSRAPSTGSRPARPSTPRCGCTITCSASRPRRRARGARLEDGLEPQLAGSADRLQSRAQSGQRRPWQPLPVRTHGLFCVDPDSARANWSSTAR